MTIHQTGWHHISEDCIRNIDCENPKSYISWAIDGFSLQNFYVLQSSFFDCLLNISVNKVAVVKTCQDIFTSAGTSGRNLHCIVDQWYCNCVLHKQPWVSTSTFFTMKFINVVVVVAAATTVCEVWAGGDFIFFVASYYNFLSDGVFQEFKAVQCGRWSWFIIGLSSLHKTPWEQINWQSV